MISIILPAAMIFSLWALLILMMIFWLYLPKSEQFEFGVLIVSTGIATVATTFFGLKIMVLSP